MKEIFIIICLIAFTISCQPTSSYSDLSVREKTSLNKDWKFFKYHALDSKDSLIYDIRPEIKKFVDSKPADSKPTDAQNLISKHFVLKPWILPSGNEFIKDTTKHYTRPEGNPGSDFPFVQSDFNDEDWETLDLPHDWAINGPFYEGDNPKVGGGMGRLPSPGVAWYRKSIKIPLSDSNKQIYLDIDGAQSYAMVWCNSKLVGGWPYGYNSWRLDLTPYISLGKVNQIAIRLDNPNHSARWYPGGGIYRNVWLTKTNAIHVAHWGTFVTTPEVSDSLAKVDLEVMIVNKSELEKEVQVLSKIYELDANGKSSLKPIAEFKKKKININAGLKFSFNSTVEINNPKLWGPLPTQVPNRYSIITQVFVGKDLMDEYETKFGIRSLKFDPSSGIYVNNELVKIKGVNQHHDLGALGAAFNTRAAERQLEILQEMGCNAIRMSHNPPAPELLDLCDSMGILVMDEIFDVWYMKKTPHDFHLIFPDWYEQDLRSMVRRDKNHPSIIMWSIGNEVGEQYTDFEGAKVAATLREIIKDEDPTRLTTSSLNWAKSYMPLPKELEVISLNYQGEGIRQDPMFKDTKRIRTKPQYDIFHKKFPNKVILGSETASAFSSRGIYYFPVSNSVSSPTRDGMGGSSKEMQVSSYDLYAVDFGSSPDKVFKAIDSHPFVAGEFVWAGFDYLGEPTPYYSARSCYNGIIDLAGFKKDRFFLYQAHWRPELPMVHILPHWNWPNRIGKVTPIHVYTSGDEVELFLNGKSLGKKKKGKYEYRLRWDDVKYEPGEVKAVAYKNGKKWAESITKTSSDPFQIELTVDREHIKADGKDLAFFTAKILDKNGLEVRTAINEIEFEVEGEGKFVASDNGDPTDFTPFNSNKRKMFSGLALAIVRSIKNKEGEIVVNAKSPGLKEATIIINSKQINNNE